MEPLSKEIRVKNLESPRQPNWFRERKITLYRFPPGIVNRILIDVLACILKD